MAKSIAAVVAVLLMVTVAALIPPMTRVAPTPHGVHTLFMGNIFPGS